MTWPIFSKKHIPYILKWQYMGNKGMKTKNQDRVIAIMGAEGIGKSHLAIWLFLYWYEEILKIPVTKKLFAKHFVAENDKFNSALHTSPKFYMNTHDEAVLLTNSARHNTRESVENNEKYMIIRGLNQYSVFNIPSILDMNKNFRNRRVKVLLYVDDFGVAYLYGRKTLDRLIPAMSKSKMYNTNPNPLRMTDGFGTRIEPDLEIHYPEYNGKFRTLYEKLKQESMKNKIKSHEPDKEREKKPKYTHKQEIYLTAYEKLNSYNKVADLFGVSKQTVYDSIKKIVKSKAVTD